MPQDLNRSPCRPWKVASRRSVRVVGTTIGRRHASNRSRTLVASGRAAVAAVVALPVWRPRGSLRPQRIQSTRGVRLTEVDLVSNIPGRAAVTDAHVQNAWGLALGPTTPLWVANNGTNTATLYAGGVGGATPTVVPLVVRIPAVRRPGRPQRHQRLRRSPDRAGPGRHDSCSSARGVTSSAGTRPRIRWWPGSRRRAWPGTSTARSTGLTLATTAFGSFLLAPTSQRADRRLRHAFNLHQPAGAVLHRPALPAGYTPFDVATLGGKMYVSYAKQDAAAEDEVAGPGNGFVDVYSGVCSSAVASRGPLNAPWGLEIAPTSFGKFAGDLLVGNFGDGPDHRGRPPDRARGRRTPRRAREADRDRRPVGAAAWHRRYRRHRRGVVQRRSER